MANSKKNPDGCCGVKTSCCGNKIPDKLIATVSSDCGDDFTFPLVLIAKTQDEVRWKGQAEFECIPPGGAECHLKQSTIELICKSSWGLELCGQSKSLSGVVCNPFSASVNFAGNECGCALGFTVAITE